MPGTPILVWFRQDLRLADNEALHAAVATGRPLVPVYLLDPAGDGTWTPGGATRWWLHGSLAALDASLRKIGSRLTLRQGDAATILPELLRETGATAVYWNRRYEPASIARDTRLKADLRAMGVEARSFSGALLREPATVSNKSGGPFQVFTPFYKHLLTLPALPAPLPAPARLAAPARWPAGVSLADFHLLPTIDWAGGMRAAWTPGEAGAAKVLDQFDDRRATRYNADRDQPALPATSRLSPHLHFGEITPRQIWHAVSLRHEQERMPGGVDPYLRQVVWHEFAHHLLFHFPHTPEQPLRPEYAKFPWRSDARALRAWQRGRTGYPIVDAGMRELWHTGWMHNRVRMITASFLVKHLLLHWSEGARWFWDTLVDADLANNTLGWQWVAGCGADAAPYFRIVKPILQGRKFDTAGAYIRKWVPELARLDDEALHAPWEVPPLLLAEAGVVLGKTYPRPLVEHGMARDRALAALSAMREA